MTENTPSEALVEAMARAIYEADDPWHVAWPWPDLQSDQAGVDHYRRCAEAAAAVVQTALDDRASTSSPVDDSETGNTSDKPDIEAAVKSDTAPVSDKLVDTIAGDLQTLCDRQAVELAERDARIRGLEKISRYATHSIGCALYQSSYVMKFPDCSCGLDAARAALGSAKV